MGLKLVIGNKNYSSWSMRPWLAMRAGNIAFDEVFIPLYTDNKADKDALLVCLVVGIERNEDLVEGDIAGAHREPRPHRPRRIVLVADHQLQTHRERNPLN